jgi:hypothetical protein
MTMLGKGVGVYAKMVGSNAPSYVLADQGDPEIVIKYPFQVTVFKDGTTFKYRVRAGSVNNIVPKIGDVYLDALEPPEGVLDGEATHRIYLKSTTSDPPVFFPNEVEVLSSTADIADTDTNGYLLLATVVVASGKAGPVNQYVYASQVLVRAKPGTATALYSWSSR